MNALSIAHRTYHALTLASCQTQEKPRFHELIHKLDLSSTAPLGQYRWTPSRQAAEKHGLDELGLKVAPLSPRDPYHLLFYAVLSKRLGDQDLLIAPLGAELPRIHSSIFIRRRMRPLWIRIVEENWPDTDERVMAMTKVIEANSEAAEYLPSFGKELRLNEASDMRRFQLAKAAMKQGDHHCIEVLYHRRQLNLSQLPLDMRLTLAHLAAESSRGAEHLTLLPNSLGFLEAPPAERMRLFLRIAAHGGYTADRLMGRYDSLKFTELKFSQLLRLCDAIARQDEELEKRVIKEFGRAGFVKKMRKTEDIQQRLHICEDLVQRAPWLARAVARNTYEAGLYDLSCEDALGLCMLIDEHSNLSPQDIASAWMSLGGARKIKDADRNQRDALIHKVSDLGDRGKIGLLRCINSLGLSGPERHALASRFAKDSDSVAEAVAQHFDFRQIGVPSSDTQALFYELLNRSTPCAMALIPHVGIFADQPWQERYELYLRIAHMDASVVDSFVPYQDRMKFSDIPNRELHELLMTLAKRSDTFAHHLIAQLMETDVWKQLNDAQQIDLFMEVARQRPDSIGIILSEHRRLPLDQMSFEEGLAFCRSIAALGWKAQEVLSRSFISFPFIRKIQEEAPESRAVKYQTLFQSGPWTCIPMHFSRAPFIFDGISLADRQQIAEALLAHGDRCVLSICRKQLILEDASTETLLALAKRCMSLGPQGAKGVLYHLSRFKLPQQPRSERLEICRLALKQGKEGALLLISSLPELTKDFSLEERMALYMECIAYGGQTSKQLLKLSSELAIEELPPKQRFILYSTMAQVSKKVAEKMIDGIEKLHLDGIAFADRMSLIQKILSKGGSLPSFLGITLCDLASDKDKRRALIEILNCDTRDYPNYLERYLDEDWFQPIQALASLMLLKEPEQQKPFDYLESLPLTKGLVSHPDPFHRFQVAEFACYTAGVFCDHSTEAITLLQSSRALEALAQHPNHGHRVPLTRQLSFLSEEGLSFLDEVPKLIPHPHLRTRVTWILLSRLKELGFSTDSLVDIASVVNRYRGFRDCRQLHHLLDFMLHIIDHHPYTESQVVSIERVLLRIMNRHVPKKAKGPQTSRMKLIRQDLQTAANLWQLFGKEEFLKHADAPDIFFSKLQDLFKIDNLDLLKERFLNTFAQYRDPNALISYRRSLETLPSTQRKQSLHYLNLYVNGVLSNNFPTLRYDTPHLNTIFEHHPQLKAIWTHNDTDTDNPEDLLLFTTEIRGSCLRITGSPQRNKCLLGFIVNGHVKPLVIRDHTGKPTARAVLRLLWDPKTKTPVLLLEKTYQNTPADNAIKSAALAKAKAMNLPLLAKLDKGSPYPNPVEFLGGHCKDNYCDAAGGYVGGRFSLSGLRVVL